MRALEKPVEPRTTLLRLGLEAELQDGEAADARDSIRRDTASLDTVFGSLFTYKVGEAME